MDERLKFAKLALGDDYSFEKLESTKQYDAYLAKSRVKDIVPDRICIAVNDKGDFGTSIFSKKEAVSNIGKNFGGL